MVSARNRPFGRLHALTLSLVTAVALVSAGHWAQQGWRDKHYNYVPRPSGYSQIVARFGEPCNANASHNWASWRAADDGQVWTFRFHRKLGGKATEMVSGKGGYSTNLDNDVHGHIKNEHLEPYVKGGIFGYLCRTIRDTNVWSTHAWGIAVDVSARYEHYGTCGSVVNYRHAHIWQNHSWYWGRAFCDSMHFQYADSY